jgi:ABC-type enterochelin transport system permease subunit
VALIGCLTGILLVGVVLAVGSFFAYRSGFVQDLIDAENL